MATSLGNTRNLITDPLRSFKFNVYIPYSPSGTIGGVSMGRLGFMSASGLGIAVETLTYREGGDNLTTRKMPGQSDFNPITLSRGLYPMDNDSWSWMQYIFTAMYGAGSGNDTVPTGTGGQGGNAPTQPDFRTYMYVNVLQHPITTPATINGQTPYNNSYPQQNSITQVSFKLYSAWIGGLAYSDWDAGGNAVAIEQMTINYEGFDVNWGGLGYVANPTSW